jgi:hypothetical protein
VVFFLGKDVTIALATEHQTNGVGVTPAGGSSAQIEIAASPTNPVAATLGGGIGTNIVQITAADVSIGAQDEDISYFGMRSVTKAEIKKETTVSLTRKKENEYWDVIFNEARYGVSGSVAYDGLSEPKATCGYRVFITINATSGTDEVITIPGCYVTGHSSTINTDGTMDETLDLMSYITPSYGTTKDTTIISTNL